MNKTELIEAIAAKADFPKTQVADVLSALEDIVVTSVKKGEKVAITGFVSFERVERKARIARNPQTNAEIHVAASKAPKVSIGASFKKAVKG